MTDWQNCEHDWELSNSEWNCPEDCEEVVCAKCGCPGERYVKTGEVFYPAT